MKKRVLAAVMGSLFLAPVAKADMLLGIYAGAQGWNTSTTGGFSESSTGSATFNFDDDEGSNTLAINIDNRQPSMNNRQSTKDNRQQTSIIIYLTLKYTL